MQRTLTLMTVLSVSMQACGIADGQRDAAGYDIIAADVVEVPDAVVDVQDAVVDQTASDSTNDATDVVDEKCLRQCEGRTCGPDGCGSICGSCPDGWDCIDGSCGISDYPDCEGKECGSDGLDGSCGECSDGWVCIEMTARCVPVCSYPEDLPTEFGYAAIIDSVQVPTEDGRNVCMDFTGDGTPDSVLSDFAADLNPDLKNLLSAVGASLVLDLSQIVNIPYMVDIAVPVYFARPVQAGMFFGEVLVYRESWEESICGPWLRFDHAETLDSRLLAGPATFRIHATIANEVILPLQFIDVSLTGDMAWNGTSMWLQDGVVTMVLTREAVTAAVKAFALACGEIPVSPAIAGICERYWPSGSVTEEIPFLPAGFEWDLHQVGDGTYVAADAANTGDAASICLKFTTAPATITGYVE